MNNQVQYHLYLREQWQKQFQQETPKKWEFESPHTERRQHFKALVSHMGKEIVRVGKYLQTITEHPPHRDRARI